MYFCAAETAFPQTSRYCECSTERQRARRNKTKTQDRHLRRAIFETSLDVLIHCYKITSNTTELDPDPMKQKETRQINVCCLVGSPSPRDVCLPLNSPQKAAAAAAAPASRFRHSCKKNTTKLCRREKEYQRDGKTATRVAVVEQQKYRPS